jgi:hypothetical protein
VIAEQPRTIVIAEQPRTIVTAEQPRTIVIAEQPRTIVIAEQPRTILSLPDDGYMLSKTRSSYDNSPLVFQRVYPDMSVADIISDLVWIERSQGLNTPFLLQV